MRDLIAKDLLDETSLFCDLNSVFSTGTQGQKLSPLLYTGVVTMPSAHRAATVPSSALEPEDKTKHWSPVLAAHASAYWIPLPTSSSIGWQDQRISQHLLVSGCSAILLDTE